MTDREGPAADPKFAMPEGFIAKLKKIVSKNPKGRAYDENGLFYPDPTPVAPPIGYKPEESMFDRVREMVRLEISKAAAGEGFESFEEADDFDIPDDYEPFSEYELILEQAAPDAPLTAPDPQPLPSGGPKPPSDSQNLSTGSPSTQGGVASPPPGPTPPKSGT